MVRSQSAHHSSPNGLRLEGAKKIFRGARPWLAIIAGFAAVALLLDFCFACLFQALR
ncbi:MAG TPA: hypothetical protein VF475_17585 [Sphingobium sp.]